jgi:hypothetical protein
MYVGGKYMHFMTTPPPTHTLRVLLVPKQKKRIKSWRHKQELQHCNYSRIQNTTYNSYLSSVDMSVLNHMMLKEWNNYITLPRDQCL